MIIGRIAALVAITVLSACGGGSGGSGTAFIPSPPTDPDPPPANANIRIFENPVAGEYATVGASIAAPGGNLDTFASPDTRFGSVSSQDPLQPHIRYSASGQYEVEMPGSSWDTLIHYKGLSNPGPENNYFQPASVAQNLGYVLTSNSRNSGYSYSELASWGSASAGRWGYMAFGSPTPAGAVPTTGTASFTGSVIGSTDILIADLLYGGYAPVGADGTVNLTFDFAGGSLSGSMSLNLIDGSNRIPIGTFSFTDTLFSAGSTTYSGRFNTALTGTNFLLGRFTGPVAQETIGAWAVPFSFTIGTANLPADSQTHQAFGAWIARRGN